MIFFAATAANVHDITAREALAAGADADSISMAPGGVEFSGTLETGYRFALWSRTASRLLLQLAAAEGIESGDQLYIEALQVPWSDHLTPDTSFAVHATVRSSRWLKDSRYAALKVKDAIADQMRELHAERPMVDTEHPDIRVQVHIDGIHALFYLDLTGESLHRRGYRRGDSAVTMKEHTAAALLFRAGWPEATREGLPLLDPFCGSGTIPIEAALIAADIAPGLLHPQSYAFLTWCGHDRELWERLLQEARSAAEAKAASSAAVVSKTHPGSDADAASDTDSVPGAGSTVTEIAGTDSLGESPENREEVSEDDAAAAESGGQSSEAGRQPAIYAWDIDPRAVQAAGAHARNAGVAHLIAFAVRDFTDLEPHAIPEHPGIIVTDPPYGVRMDGKHLSVLYRKAGEILQGSFSGWQVSMICGEPELLQEIGMKPDSTNVLYNGGIACTVAHYTVFTPEDRERMKEKAEARRRERETAELSFGAQMFANRLRKNRRMLKAFLRRTGTTSYRLYDADMPEYSAAIDIYEDMWAAVQEYAPPNTIDPASAARRLQEMVDGVNRVTGIPYERIFVKQRKRQKGKDQYTRLESKGTLYIMREEGLRFYVNFTDYIDTGIFLDHRPVRKLIGELSSGKRFLNLFGYTGTATVYAAAGGALSTMTVDASRTYLAWAEKNLELNGFDGMAHQLQLADCFQWLETTRHRFDLIFLDPPTFSNSKSRPDQFDIQRDHEQLIISAMRHLEKGGTLVFSTNFRRFELSPLIPSRYVVEEITEQTIPDDFARDSSIHRCWLIRLKTRAVHPAPESDLRQGNSLSASRDENGSDERGAGSTAKPAAPVIKILKRRRDDSGRTRAPDGMATVRKGKKRVRAVSPADKAELPETGEANLAEVKSRPADSAELKTGKYTHLPQAPRGRFSNPAGKRKEFSRGASDRSFEQSSRPEPVTRDPFPDRTARKQEADSTAKPRQDREMRGPNHRTASGEQPYAHSPHAGTRHAGTRKDGKDTDRSSNRGTRTEAKPYRNAPHTQQYSKGGSGEQFRGKKDDRRPEQRHARDQEHRYQPAPEAGTGEHKKSARWNEAKVRNRSDREYRPVRERSDTNPADQSRSQYHQSEKEGWKSERSKPRGNSAGERKPFARSRQKPSGEGQSFSRSKAGQRGEGQSFEQPGKKPPGGGQSFSRLQGRSRRPADRDRNHTSDDRRGRNSAYPKGKPERTEKPKDDDLKLDF